MNVFLTNQQRRTSLWRTYHSTAYAALCTWLYNKTDSFFLQSETSISPPSVELKSSFDFDLSNQSYYLLLALGALDSSSGNIGYHTGGQLMSGDKVNLAEFSAPPIDKNLLITLHAG